MSWFLLAVPRCPTMPYDVLISRVSHDVAVLVLFHVQQSRPPGSASMFHDVPRSCASGSASMSHDVPRSRSSRSASISHTSANCKSLLCCPDVLKFNHRNDVFACCFVLLADFFSELTVESTVSKMSPFPF